MGVVVESSRKASLSLNDDYSFIGYLFDPKKEKSQIKVHVVSSNDDVVGHIIIFLKIVS